VSLSDYERRMWAEIVAHLTDPNARSPRRRGSLRTAQKVVLGLLIGVSALLLATALGAITATGIALLMGVGSYAVVLVCVGAVVGAVLLLSPRQQP
jgi:hypothetical protein